MKHRIFCCAAAAVLSILGSCKTSSENSVEDFKTGDFLGVVYDSRNRPCRGAVITILRGRKELSFRTDINGRFIITDLPRGEHVINISKEGFESQEVTLDYTSRKQVLYTSLVSQETLLDWTETALDELEWGAAEGYLDRARRVDSGSSRLLSLEGAFHYQNRRFEDALDRWNALLEKGHRDPFLFLMIADTYQYGLERPEEALEWLNRYLESREDESVRERRDALLNRNAGEG